jgi:hypothetical protein
MKRFAKQIGTGRARLIQVVLAGVLIVTIAGWGVPGPSAAAVVDTAAQNVPTGGQEFEDVPATNPFYDFINNLYRDGLIGGYACGGPGEPCVPPNNRPYYRPNADVTRGQMSKFVDQGRRNIAVAVGDQLTLTSPAGTALDANATAASSYAGNFDSDSYRSLGVQKADGFFAQIVELSPNGATAIGLRVEGTVSIGGNLTVTGSKTGYVVDIMQNAGDSPLQAGDVVVVVGNSPAVLGEIPVVTVKRASQSYDTGAIGVVDQVVYVPDAGTQAKYLAEQQALREARDKPAGAKLPEITVTDDMGSIHVDATATQAEVGAYMNVVTLGSYKGVKVDASFGSIKAGDLLTTSPNPGYAMKVTDKAEATGAIIGKALGNLDSGTGLIPVMVTLK